MISFLKKNLLYTFLFIFLGLSTLTPSTVQGISSKNKPEVSNKIGVTQKTEQSNQIKSKREDVLKTKQNITTQRNMQNSPPDQKKGRKEWKARGIIIKFHRWPDAKQQKEIVKRLIASGLKQTKSIKSFETQLFEWKEGGLKPSQLGDKACKKLKDLSNVKRCNPDHLLPLNYFQRFPDLKTSFLTANTMSDTEADFVEDCTSCREQNLLPEIPIPLDNNIRTCNVLSCKEEQRRGKPSCKHLSEGKLSDYWAQELIGSDLLREELKNTPPPSREHWIVIFDSKTSNHSASVKNLISDKGYHAVLPELEDKKISSFQTHDDEEYKRILPVFETSFPGDYISKAVYLQKSAPHFINNSMSWMESEDIYDVFQKLSPPAIVVASAGNGFPHRLEGIKGKASKNFDTILVGSFSPGGFVSEFSNSGGEVHIVAPSDYLITSADKNGEYEKFGGTSGAAPLVTGSLAGFEWLSGYHPTSKEAKILLEKTAFPTLHSHEEPQINGVGLLNAYKLGVVAKRLKEKCKNKSLFCFKEEILNEENYHFDLEKLDKDLKQDLNRVFPSCSGEEKSSNFLEVSNCKEKREVFQRLRKAIFLDPAGSKELLKNLSCIYRKGGFSQNAEALDKLALALGSKEEVRASVKALAEGDSYKTHQLILKGGKFNFQEKEKKQIANRTLRLMLGMGGFEEEFNLFKEKRAVSMAGAMGKRGLPLINRAFNTDDSDLQETAVTAAGNIGEPGLPIVQEAFNTNEYKLKRAAVIAAGNIGEPGLPIVEEAFNSDDPEFQEGAIIVAIGMGESGAPIMERALRSGNFSLEKKAVGIASKMGEPGVSFLDEAFDDVDYFLQLEIMGAVSRLGEPALPLAEKAFNSGDLNLQSLAMSTAGNMGEPGLPILEKGFNISHSELQMQAVEHTSRIGKPALPLFRRMLENTALYESTRQAIKQQIIQLEQ